ncbi:hypothetical protein [Verrucosispora sp. NA02020]|uniref:hypothetical protein n=1 Tax=Verrucosispora sp. NA02020 TaxID=2742132 RepID=UPI001590A64A|nr:hypothetical protein [Verrucosispora sp. NA02020]QKW15429.1 hypothetical protein HUT12_23455 [Verrucosispora sp. NA02020]
MPTLTPTDVTVIRTYGVTGAEPIDKRYTSVRIIPDEVTITFDNGTASHVKIAGYSAKKDGTAGAARHNAEYWIGSVASDMPPEWVAPLLEFTPV